MAIIKQLDKRSGITYVYESTSYWDKEKQQPTGCIDGGKYNDRF